MQNSILQRRAACCVFRCAPRTTRHALRTKHYVGRNRQSPIANQQCRASAFTLIEIMIVVGIAALVMATAVPFVHNALHKDVLRQAVSDVVEACTHARAYAIFTGVPAELKIRPHEGTFQIVAASGQQRETPTSIGYDSGEERPVVPAQTANFAARFSDKILIEELAVNFHPFKDAEEARVRFYPNGTSDEFTLVISYEAQPLRKVSLDVVTGSPDVQVLEGRVWK